jgi:hypothetical protein
LAEKIKAEKIKAEKKAIAQFFYGFFYFYLAIFLSKYKNNWWFRKISKKHQKTSKNTRKHQKISENIKKYKKI